MFVQHPTFSDPLNDSAYAFNRAATDSHYTAGKDKCRRACDPVLPPTPASLRRSGAFRGRSLAPKDRFHGRVGHCRGFRDFNIRHGSPDYRRSGFGTVLLLARLLLLPDTSAPRMLLITTVRAASSAFYSRFGFTYTGTSPDQSGNQANHFYASYTKQTKLLCAESLQESSFSAGLLGQGIKTPHYRVHRTWVGSRRPEAVLQLKTLPTKKGRTYPSLTGPKTLPVETI
jgi:GNAT superfamily N-acetyltransferase